ncbi:LegC family aminotransferase [Brevundimonas sp.]|uniref:LegC family aminotransferase n=1 Tax=Brevundimonas sp. TaxID=1871086 RepID=UPI002737C502|nr:LegC family aminotransferase [Brevundimonas sp.]MDP3803012.1 LegC family aminotransferase [Brevundimonas sp.]
MTDPAVLPRPDPDPVAERIVAAVRRALRDPDGPAALHQPEFRGQEWAYIKDCLDTGWVSSVGAWVDRFERALEQVTGVSHAVAASTGTAALHICMKLAGVVRGDEVLVPALTFVATANAVTYEGATPHFVDADMECLGVDPDALEAHLQATAVVEGDVCRNRTTGAVIRALVVTHIFGLPCDLDALAALAERWRLVLIEDAAEALGSFREGVHVGGRGRLAALSFNGNKIVTTGGGGAILTNDADLARRAKHLTTTAKRPHAWSFDHDEIGYNYRLPNLNAALGCAQLERLDDMIVRKRVLAGRYAEALAGVEGVRLLTDPPGCRSNAWLNSLVLEAPELRDAVLTALNGAGLMSRPTWTLMHRLPMYAACPRAPLGHAERLEAGVISLPSSACLADT